MNSFSNRGLNKRRNGSSNVWYGRACFALALAGHCRAPRSKSSVVSNGNQLKKAIFVDDANDCEDWIIARLGRDMMTKVKAQGLVSDLMPNIKLMQAAGHFLFNYHSENGGMTGLLRKIYASTHAILITIHFACMGINMAQYSDEVNELTANTITVLFFTHTIIKLGFFALNSKSFYRTLAVWNQSNSHPLFTESDARYHQIALTKMRRLLYFICGMTVLSVVCWVTLTFFGESVRLITSKETNETLTEVAPRLPLKAWYPFNAMSGTMYIIAFAFQVYWLLFSMAIANLMDVMFCSWLIFACEQLQHLKAIMKPLMELSASLDTYRPNTAELFRASSTEKSEKIPDTVDMDIRGIYSTQQDFGMTLRGAGGRLQNFGQQNNNPNGLTPKQEMLARSAIKYWVERHKHVIGGFHRRHVWYCTIVPHVGVNHHTYSTGLPGYEGTFLTIHPLPRNASLVPASSVATAQLSVCGGRIPSCGNLLITRPSVNITRVKWAIDSKNKFVSGWKRILINGINVYAFSTIGYLSYTLGQVFHFCIFGNRLIEESSSVMEAAYSCQWYDGSEEAKTFVQIVCQQCQKAMSISGAKFFTVSLDLFASYKILTYNSSSELLKK
ncbi:hypothetical protein HW555_011861 [Spodoptera exigua]|uniref:Odorant receptor coreceptor n=1 Tax=Spodoptera exigua TaxID=7107 RepID=A0A835L194_SPOEX|nr:hypothetical protein HW555_011861 [Spodoptera exigua]